MADVLIPAVARKGRILDIGCGSIPYFLSSIRFQEKHGLDKGHETEEMELPEEKIIKVTIFKGEPIFIFDVIAPYEVVTMLAVFEHIASHQIVTLLSEVYRVMKPGEQYILTTRAAWADIILRILTRLGLVSREEIDEHKDRYTHKKIAGLLTKSGFY